MKYVLPPFLKEPERSIDFVGLRKANRAVWTNPLLNIDPLKIANSKLQIVDLLYLKFNQLK